MLNAPSSPLVIRFGAFGDMVLLIPALKLLAGRYGAPCDVVSSGGWTRPLLERVPAVAEMRLLTSRRAPYWCNRSQRELVAQLRQRPNRPVYVFEPDDKPLSWLRRAGISADRICTLRDFPREPGEHLLTQTLRMAQATPAAFRGAPVPRAYLGTGWPDGRPTLRAADRDDCERWMSTQALVGVPVILIQPGNKKTMKRGDRRRSSNVDYWPETNWAEVIEGVLRHEPAAKVVICGAPPEAELADDIVAHLAPAERARVVAGSRELPLIRLLALQERAHSMISVNTGPAHSAAAMGCPLAVMFTRHPHRAADLYAPVATSAAVRVVLPESTAPDAGLDQITAASVVRQWRTLPKRDAVSA